MHVSGIFAGIVFFVFVCLAVKYPCWFGGRAMGILVGITAAYVVFAWRTMDELLRQAEASKMMANEMHNQRLDMLKPVIALRGVGSSVAGMPSALQELSIVKKVSSKNALEASIVNVGKGPALDVEIEGIGRLSALRDGEFLNIEIPAGPGTVSWPPALSLEIVYKDLLGNRKHTSVRLSREPDGTSREIGYKIVQITLADHTEAEASEKPV
jgi:hypothetical protein